LGPFDLPNLVCADLGARRDLLECDHQIGGWNDFWLRLGVRQNDENGCAGDESEDNTENDKNPTAAPHWLPPACEIPFIKSF
jgi:hypothetical protein